MTIRLIERVALLIVMGVSGCGGGGADPGGSGASPGGSLIDSAPTISAHPQDAFVVAGQSATFSATAAGNPTTSYQWLRDDQVIAGARGSSYTVFSAALVDQGSRFAVRISALVAESSGPRAVEVTSNPAILHVSGSSNAAISLLAGGLGGSGHVDGSTTVARFGGGMYRGNPVAVDAADSIFIADPVNRVIRRVSRFGHVSTFAGSPGQDGYVDARGSEARFSRPSSLALDALGNLYVADNGARGAMIRKITPEGTVATLAGGPGTGGPLVDGTGKEATFGLILGLATDATGNVYVGDGHLLRRITPSGKVTTIAGADLALGSVVEGMAVDSSGIVHVIDNSDFSNQRVHKVTPAGVVSTLTLIDGTGARVQVPADGIAFAANGDLVLSDGYSITVVDKQGAVKAITYVNSPASDPKSLQRRRPFSFALEKTGGLVAMSLFGTTLYRVAPDGTPSLIAGSANQSGFADNRGSGARFNAPGALVVDAVGNIYVADVQNSAVRKITPAGVVSTVAGGTFGTADGAGAFASFALIRSLAIDTLGNIYVSDAHSGLSRIRKVTPAGLVTTLADFATFYSAGQYTALSGIAVDTMGNVLACDDERGVRSVAPSGSISVISTPGCRSLVVDRFGNTYLLSSDFTLNRLNTDGTLTFVAGKSGDRQYQDGVGANARFDYDGSGTGQMTTDASGNIYLVDPANAVIRKITPAGVVSTAVGTRGLAQVMLDLPGGLNRPNGIAVAPGTSGLKLVISDANEHAVLLFPMQ